jgi:hypothetical protein
MLIYQQRIQEISAENIDIKSKLSKANEIEQENIYLRSLIQGNNSENRGRLLASTYCQTEEFAFGPQIYIQDESQS